MLVEVVNALWHFNDWNLLFILILVTEFINADAARVAIFECLRTLGNDFAVVLIFQLLSDVCLDTLLSLPLTQSLKLVVVSNGFSSL